MNSPLVSCVCLTRNRREWLPKAIACFQAQTYENRELVIISDGESVIDLVPQRDPRIRLMVLGWSHVVVGEKRNIGAEAARGNLIAHWDDDDYSAPGRLAHQVDVLQLGERAVTGFRHMKFTDGQSWWEYRGAKDFALATSLCYRKDWWASHPFQHLQCGQDELFSDQAAAKRQLNPDPRTDLMYATIHPGNTSPRVLTSPCWIPLPDFKWTEAA